MKIQTSFVRLLRLKTVFLLLLIWLRRRMWFCRFLYVMSSFLNLEVKKSNLFCESCLWLLVSKYYILRRKLVRQRLR
jgi:hypothetical protein